MEERESRKSDPISIVRVVEISLVFQLTEEGDFGTYLLAQSREGSTFSML